jgi:hypothetical protein
LSTTVAGTRREVAREQREEYAAAHVQAAIEARSRQAAEADRQAVEARKNNCTGFGFTPNSDAHAQCVMQLFIAEEAQAASNADTARAQAASAAQADRMQAALRAQQAAQAAALKEAEDYARRQRQSEILIGIGGNIARGCGLAPC